MDTTYIRKELERARIELALAQQVLRDLLNNGLEYSKQGIEADCKVYKLNQQVDRLELQLLNATKEN